MRAWAFESLRFLSHASNVAERRISYTEELYPMEYGLSTMVYEVSSPNGRYPERRDGAENGASTRRETGFPSSSTRRRTL